MQMLDPVVPPRQANRKRTSLRSSKAIRDEDVEKKREQRYASMSDLLQRARADPAAPLRRADALAPASPAGADPALSPLTPTSVIKAGDSTSAAPVERVRNAVGSTNLTKPRRAKPQTRPLHEPEFAAPGSRSRSRTSTKNRATCRRRRACR